MPYIQEEPVHELERVNVEPPPLSASIIKVHNLVCDVLGSSVLKPTLSDTNLHSEEQSSGGSESEAEAESEDVTQKLPALKMSRYTAVARNSELSPPKNAMELPLVGEVKASESRCKPVIEVRNLVKRYNKAEKNAVNAISFSVEPGTFFALLGPNGAGKTTTISILTTMLTPTSGSVHIAGYDIVKEAAAVRRHIGIVFQRPSLDLHLTAEENIRFHACLYGLYTFSPSFRLMAPAYREQVYALAELLGLKKHLFQPVKTLSGGMKRKLEIVRSLLHQPSVLFLDEPTSGLDPDSRSNLWNYLQQVRKERQMTLFLTTHYLEEAEVADTICIINKGCIAAYGSPEQVKGSLTTTSLLIDAQNRDQLCSELKLLGYIFEELPPFRLSVTEQQAHQILQTIRTPLNFIRVSEPTLDDVYLAIVRNA